MNEKEIEEKLRIEIPTHKSKYTPIIFTGNS